jgi:hypothetical protein
MLAEIEDLITKVLQDSVKGIPKEKISALPVPATPPAITILSRHFKIESQMTESTGQKRTQLDESFSVEGNKPILKLKNKPIDDEIAVESPPGSRLEEDVDYSINLNQATITFIKNEQTKLKGKVRYYAQNDYLSKTLRLVAKYVIDVNGKDWDATDALAEEVLRAMILNNEEFESRGIQLKPLAGRTTIEEGKENERRIQLAYLVEKEIEIETSAPSITKIEIFKKKP